LSVYTISPRRIHLWLVEFWFTR